ncbi:TPA: hypothetical protein ACH3X1_004139 [Trebouxia sp. C0004]
MLFRPDAVVHAAVLSAVVADLESLLWTGLLLNSLLLWRQVHLAVIVQLSYVCQGCLSWSWTYIVCLPDCLAMRLVLQSTAVGNRWPTMFCRICNILIYMQEPHIFVN